MAATEPADARRATEDHGRGLTLATIGLGLLAALYLAQGFYDALFGVMPQDLARRWLEGAYVVRHINPLDVYAGVHAPEPDIGPAHPGGYPPFSTAIGLLVAPPIRKEWLRIYFAALNALALGVTARYVVRAAERHGQRATWLFLASAFAIAANAIVLRHGQYGILINAMLAFLLTAAEAGKSAQGGIWLGLAALKPQTSAPFALLWLRLDRLLALVVAALFVALLSVGLLAWIGSSPSALFSQLFGQAAAWDGGDAGPLRLLLTLGVPRGTAIPALAGVGVLSGLYLLQRYREAPASIHAAILCVVGRLWTYHRRYDDVMLLFLLLPLGLAAIERGGRRAWVSFIAVGLTLWLPFREIDHGSLLITAKTFIWVAALGWLLSGIRRSEA